MAERSHVAPVERLSLSVTDAVAATGIGRSTLYVLMDEGKLAYVKVRGRRLIPIAAIRDLLARSAVQGSSCTDR